MLQSLDRGAKAVLLVMVSLVLQWILSWVVQWLFPAGVTVVGWHLVMILVEGLAILLPAVLFLRSGDTPVSALLKEGERTLSGMEALLIVLAAAAGLMLMDALATMVALLFLQLGIPLVTSQVPVATQPGLFGLSLLSVAIMPGFSEELLFRGALFGALKPHGTRRALLLSALLFAMMHGILQALPVHFLLGLVMGLLFYYTGSLYAAILYHSLHNAFALVLDGITSTGETSGVTLEMLMTDPQLLSMMWMTCLIMALLFGAVWAFSLRGVFRRAQADRYFPEWIGKDAAKPMGKALKWALALAFLLEASLYIRSLWLASGAA